jgi:hypothetical protein
VATWDDVRRLALALPEAEESTTYRKPAYKVGGRAFAWESPHEHGTLVLRCDPGERPLMIEARPEMFFVVPHYEAHPMVLVHVEEADGEELADRIEESWLLTAPRKLAERGPRPRAADSPEAGFRRHKHC